MALGAQKGRLRPLQDSTGPLRLLFQVHRHKHWLGIATLGSMRAILGSTRAILGSMRAILGSMRAIVYRRPKML